MMDIPVAAEPLIFWDASFGMFVGIGMQGNFGFAATIPYAGMKATCFLPICDASVARGHVLSVVLREPRLPGRHDAFAALFRRLHLYRLRNWYLLDRAGIFARKRSIVSPLPEAPTQGLADEWAKGTVRLPQDVP